MPSGQSRSTPVLQALNVVSLLVTLTVNYLANALPLNGKTTGQLSDQYPNLFTPAGLTFSIWGLIYVGLLAFVVYQTLLLFARRYAAEVEPVVRRIDWLFAATCLLNSAWIFAWHYEAVTLSVVVMGLFLLTLTVLNQRLLVGLPPTGRTRWFVQAPFALYWGWISIATIANVTAWLVYEGWDGFGLPEVAWTIALIAVGTLITLVVLRRTHQWAYGAVVIWAFAGIILKRQAALGESRPGIIAAAALGILLIAIALAALLRRRVA